MGYAMLDLLDYWLHAEGSISPDNPDRTFWYAIRRAEWMGVQYLGQTAHATYAQDSLDALRESGQEPVDDDEPGDALLEDEDRAHAQALVRDLDETRGGWLRSYLGGQTSREVAEQEGVSHTAILERWRTVTNELRASARSLGYL